LPAALRDPVRVGAFLAVKGFWPILPFAGLEMALLGWALKRPWSAASTARPLP